MLTLLFGASSIGFAGCGISIYTNYKIINRCKNNIKILPTCSFTLSLIKNKYNNEESVSSPTYGMGFSGGQVIPVVGKTSFPIVRQRIEFLSGKYSTDNEQLYNGKFLRSAYYKFNYTEVNFNQIYNEWKTKFCINIKNPKDINAEFNKNVFLCESLYNHLTPYTYVDKDNEFIFSDTPETIINYITNKYDYLNNLDIYFIWLSCSFILFVCLLEM
jgi:hypothetical protein